MDTLDLPLFLRAKDCGDMQKYDSLAAMERDLEAIDVENEEYEAWDNSAIPLLLSVQPGRNWLQVKAQGEAQPERLADAILEFARAHDVEVANPAMNGFAAVLDQITSVLKERLRRKPWWYRLMRRF